MAYNRKRRFRGRSRRVLGKRRRGGRRYARRIRTFVKRAVKSMSEAKWVYSTGSTTGQDPSISYVTKFNTAVPQGTDNGQRIGNQLRTSRVSLKGAIYFASTSATQYVIRFRITFGYFREVPANWPVVTANDIYDVSTAPDYTYCQVNKLLFKPLMDKVYRRGTNGGYQTLGYKHFIDWQFSTKWRKVWSYRSAGQTGVDFDYEAFPVCIYTSNAATGLLTFSPSLTWKFTYYDI